MALFNELRVTRDTPLTPEQLAVLQEGSQLAEQFGLDERYRDMADVWLEAAQEWAFEDLEVSVEVGCDEETTAGDREYYDSQEQAVLGALATDALFAFGIESAAYKGSKSALLTMFKVDDVTGSELPHSKYSVGMIGEERPAPMLYEGECFDLPDDQIFALERVLTQRKAGLFYSTLATVNTTLAGEAQLEWALNGNQLLAQAFIDLAWFDQNMRAKAVTGDYQWHDIIDTDNETEFRLLLERYGWPTISHVGDAAAHAATTILQYAPNPVFVEECLNLMKACPPGEVMPWNIAYVEDHMLVISNQPQLYGTQFKQTESGAELYPVASPESVDERRARMGLGSLAAYKSDLRLLYPA